VTGLSQMIGGSASNKSLGYFQHIPKICADLGEIAAGMRAGRENASEKMCANLCSVTENMGRAIRIYKRAVENNIGTWLDL
jgi:hypothetical protein